MLPYRPTPGDGAAGACSDSVAALTCAQGSTDGGEWTDLRRHTNDGSLRLPGQFASWPVSGQAAARSFRHYRVGGPDLHVERKHHCRCTFGAGLTSASGPTLQTAHTPSVSGLLHSSQHSGSAMWAAPCADTPSRTLCHRLVARPATGGAPPGAGRRNKPPARAVAQLPRIVRLPQRRRRQAETVESGHWLAPSCQTEGQTCKTIDMVRG